MFLQYEIIIKNEREERGIINLEHVTSIQIEQHGGGYGKAIVIYYLNQYEGQCIFILNDEAKLNAVYEALCNSITGNYISILGIGFFRPIYYISSRR
jgi:hypothetical protein